jgi:hypothetical protein
VARQLAGAEAPDRPFSEAMTSTSLEATEPRRKKKKKPDLAVLAGGAPALAEAGLPN